MDEMERAYRQDTADLQRIQDLAGQIREFIQNPPARCPQSTLRELGLAKAELDGTALHIQAVWN